MKTQTPLRLAVLLSGSGTTLENIFQQYEGIDHDEPFPGKVEVVISSRGNAFGLKRAEQRNVPALTVSRKAFANVDEYSKAVFDALEPYAPDLICLAGFMSLLKIPKAYEHKILNIHPALLPSFGGKGYFGDHVHEAVLQFGCKISGCTVHFVDNQYDHGPILSQRSVPVLEDDSVDTLGERVRAAERILYPEAIRLIATGRVQIVDGKAFISYE